MQTQFKEYDTQSGAATSCRRREADSYYNDMAKGGSGVLAAIHDTVYDEKLAGKLKLRKIP
jgi:hypothetical protein